MSPFTRATGAASPNPSRKPSIVEMLSSPPPLNQDDESLGMSISRNPSVSSRASSATGSVIGDWNDIQLSELTDGNKLISIPAKVSVQQAFETLKSHNLTSVPVSRTNDTDLTNCGTFDYSDLNTYLLLVMNKISVGDAPANAEYVAKAKRGEEVPVEFIIHVHPKNPFIRFNEHDYLPSVMETLGNGVHRVAITDNSGKVTGILSQRRLIRFMWENARRFPSLEGLFDQTLEQLQIGATNPMTIYDDQLLIEALTKMHTERVSSLAVIDHSHQLIGNISITDVQNVTSSKNSALLFKSVLNFISYNLSQKGIERGQDQFPIFHVRKSSTLGRVVAKLVATQSHRLWIVESPSKSQDTPTKDPGQGKLIGVVSLTDILGLFAETKGKKTDPTYARNQRRRSSTSTTRSSIDM
ncbi:protein Sds24p [Diutina rugosa]